MIYHQAKDPTAYQTIFYRQIGLKKQEEETGNSWRDDEGGYIYTFGTMDTIQMGIGEYTVPVDFLSEFQYDTEYLHAGIIYEGVTYSLVHNHMKEFATPSAFLAMEQAAGGINCWKKGQHFKGVEISVELGYLRETLLPFLGLSAEALDFLEKNVRYLHLPEELQDLIFRVEQLLRKQEMTESLLRSLAAEFVSQLVRPEIRSVFANGEAMLTGKIKVGKKEIRMKKEDFQKIIQVHDRIRDHAETFVTIYALSQEFSIGEQKLKAGFQKLYQQTIWDYANQVRMNRAAVLLKDPEKSIAEISALSYFRKKRMEKAAELLENTGFKVIEIANQVGYENQGKFAGVFAETYGVTPLEFRRCRRRDV